MAQKQPFSPVIAPTLNRHERYFGRSGRPCRSGTMHRSENRS